MTKNRKKADLSALLGNDSDTQRNVRDNGCNVGDFKVQDPPWKNGMLCSFMLAKGSVQDSGRSGHSLLRVTTRFGLDSISTYGWVRDVGFRKMWIQSHHI